MKDQLIRWGFEEVEGSTLSTLCLTSGSTKIRIKIIDNTILETKLYIGEFGERLPNCNNELALMNLLYILGLLEV